MMQQFHFLRPEWFWLLLPLVWLVWRYAHRHSQGGSWQDACDPHLLPHLLVNNGTRASRLPLVILALSGLLAIVALAGPTWSRIPQPVYRNTAATVVVLNLSQSMNATDLQPNRLERARLKLLDFLQRQREGQTALIVYTSEAYVVSPLTDDSATIASMVNALQTNIMPVQGNDLAPALKKADALLEQDGVYRGGRVLLITDNAGGKRALKAAARLAQKGRVLSVLGIGTTQGAPIPANGGGFVTNKQGAIVIPRLDPKALTKLARVGNGRFVTLTTTDSDLDLLWPSAQALRLNTKRSGHSHAADVWREQGPWLLLIVIPLLAFAGRQGWLALIVLAVIIQPHPAEASTWSNFWLRPDQQAYHALLHGNAKSAAKLFKNPDWKSVAEYRAGNYAAAAAGFAHDHTPQALYNEANALAHLGKLEAAVQNYRKVLTQQPHNQDAKHNLKIVENLLKHQQQKRQNRQNKNQHGRGKSNQNQKSSTHSGNGQSGQQQAKNTRQANSTQHQSRNHQAGNSSQQRAKNTNKDQSSSQQHAQTKTQAHNNTAKNRVGGSQQQRQNTQPQQANANQQQSGQNIRMHRQGGDSSSDTEQRSAGAKTAQQARQEAGKNPYKQRLPAAASSEQNIITKSESEQALRQWLRRIPDDPGGLLRRKFMLEHERREEAEQNNGN